MLEFAIANWRWLLPVIALAAVAIDDGRLRIDVAHLETTIAEKDRDIAGMKTRQAENIAAAEKKARDTMQADIDRGNAIVADLRRELADQTEKRNAAEISLAAIPVAPTPAGCPEPMALPVLDAFARGLPDR